MLLHLLKPMAINLPANFDLRLTIARDNTIEVVWFGKAPLVKVVGMSDIVDYSIPLLHPLIDNPFNLVTNRKWCRKFGWNGAREMNPQ
jgi:hypothetical protein